MSMQISHEKNLRDGIPPWFADLLYRLIGTEKEVHLKHVVGFDTLRGTPFEFICLTDVSTNDMLCVYKDDDANRSARDLRAFLLGSEI